MNDEERQVITGIFKRLEDVAHQPRDPQAERLISDLMQRQPYAPYAMAQSLFVQEQAVNNLHQQVQALQAEVQRLGQSQQSGGFLSSLFGGGSRPSQSTFVPPSGTRPQGYAPRQAPWGGQPGGQYGQQPMQASPWGGRTSGSGFMQTAMGTAMGVAGGMMLGSALSSAFSGAQNPLESLTSGFDPANALDTGAATETETAAADTSAQDASYDDSGDMNFDDGGGDWA